MLMEMMQKMKCKMSDQAQKLHEQALKIEEQTQQMVELNTNAEACFKVLVQQLDRKIDEQTAN